MGNNSKVWDYKRIVWGGQCSTKYLLEGTGGHHIHCILYSDVQCSFIRSVKYTRSRSLYIVIITKDDHIW